MGLDSLHPATRWSLRIGAAAVVVGILAFAAVVAATFESGTATAEPIRIDTSADGARVVTLIDPLMSPLSASRALSDAGIRNEIVGVMTGPSRVDTIVSISIDRELQLEPSTTDRLTLPAGFWGTTVLNVGVATPPGQAYATPSDPFAVGEPLAGLAGVRTAAAVARAASEQLLTVTIIGEAGQSMSADEAGGATVLFAIMVAPGSLLICLV